MSTIDLTDIFEVAPLGMSVCLDARSPLLLNLLPGATLHDIMPAATMIPMLVREHSAILIRTGADLSPTVARSLARALLPAGEEFVTGEHPELDDTEGVYRPTMFAPDEKLLWHHENSFNIEWPRYIAFVCQRPAQAGGETPIVDGRLIFDSVQAAAIEQFSKQGIVYERLCDGRAGRSWKQLFRTDDAATAARLAEINEEALVVAGDNAVIRAKRPAFLKVRNGTSWFNQLLHWHPRALPTEIRDHVKKKTIPAYRHCTFGDGSEIPEELVDELIEIHAALEFAIEWRKGDILLLDNEVIAHGRNPFRGRRDHLVLLSGRGRHDSCSQTS